MHSREILRSTLNVVRACNAEKCETCSPSRLLAISYLADLALCFPFRFDFPSLTLIFYLMKVILEREHCANERKVTAQGMAEWNKNRNRRSTNPLQSGRVCLSLSVAADCRSILESWGDRCIGVERDRIVARRDRELLSSSPSRFFSLILSGGDHIRLRRQRRTARIVSASNMSLRRRDDALYSAISVLGN